MTYSITFREEDYKELASYLLSDRKVERVAYALCTLSESEMERRILVRKIITVESQHINFATETEVSVKPVSFVNSIKQARNSEYIFMLIHSHPSGFTHHSKRDDEIEPGFFRTVFGRVPNKDIHVSLVISDEDKPSARVWHEDGSNSPVDVVRVIGRRIRIFRNRKDNLQYPNFFDRQVRAFGSDMQFALKNMKIGIVGVGGTGSAVAEQLIRLGVGTLYIFDGQKFEATNINRVYGSRMDDVDVPKTEIVTRNSVEIGLKTEILSFGSIVYESNAKKLKECEIVFGCTDDNLGRSILCRIALYYYIPVFDMGVRIDSEEEIIKSIIGRITFLFPNNACLICRKRIDQGKIAAESMELTNPLEAVERRKQGYIPELNEPAPSVITFTSPTASFAINEFINRLTGFIDGGDENESNEILFYFDRRELKRNFKPASENCLCGNPDKVGQGDSKPFLGRTWPRV